MRPFAVCLAGATLLGACATPEFEAAVQSLPSRNEVTAPFLYGKAAWRVRDYTVRPGETVRVGAHVWIADDCKLEERAEVETRDPPAHGRIEVGSAKRRVTEINSGEKWAHCKGKSVPVTTVAYTAPQDFRGRDSFAYERVRPSTGRRDLVVVGIVIE